MTTPHEQLTPQAHAAWDAGELTGGLLPGLAPGVVAGTRAWRSSRSAPGST